MVFNFDNFKLFINKDFHKFRNLAMADFSIQIQLNFSKYIQRF